MHAQKRNRWRITGCSSMSNPLFQTPPSDLYMQKYIDESIHLQSSEFCVNPPFKILMTLQQSVVAERGWEPGGFSSERAESILWRKKGAKSVVVMMADSIFEGQRYSRTTPPFLLPLPAAVAHQAGDKVLDSATCKWTYVSYRQGKPRRGFRKCTSHVMNQKLFDIFFVTVHQRWSNDRVFNCICRVRKISC